MANEKELQGGLEKLQSFLDGLSDNQKNEMYKLLVKDKEKRGELKEELVGFKEGVLNDLKKNHIKIEENAEMMGYKGRKIYIDLPAAGDFKGFKFDCFVSDEYTREKDFEENPEIIEKLFSVDDILNLARAWNDYMHAYSLDLDTELDFYKEKLPNFHRNILGSLENIVGLEKWYWLKNKNELLERYEKHYEKGKIHRHTQWDCDRKHAYQIDRELGCSGYLLFKLTN